MKQFPNISTPTLLKRLAKPKSRVSVVLDTDTYNEVDDPFALAHAILSPNEIELNAVYAAPFFNTRSKNPGDGMEKSYHEIHKLLKLLKREKQYPVLRGSKTYLPKPDIPVESPAARDLIERAQNSDPEHPLYVLAIGAFTNIASAILMEPSIIERIVIVLIGGQAFCHHTAEDFNLGQDLHASKLLFNCGVPLIHIPCHPITSHLATTVHEVQYHLSGKNPFCDYLVDILRDYAKTEEKPGPEIAWSKVIWDIAVTSWLVVPKAFRTELVHSPVLTDNITWSFDRSRHLIAQVSWVDRDRVFGDVFAKLAQ